MLKYHKDIECFTAFSHTSYMRYDDLRFFSCTLPFSFLCSYSSVSVHIFFFYVRIEENAFEGIAMPEKMLHRKQTHSIAERWWLHCKLCYATRCIRPRLSVFLPKFILWPSLLLLSLSLPLVLSPFCLFLFTCSLAQFLFFFFFFHYFPSILHFLFVYPATFLLLDNSLQKQTRANIYPLEMF